MAVAAAGRVLDLGNGVADALDSERAAALRAAFRDAVDQVRVRVAAADPGDSLTVAEKRARGPSRPRCR